MARRRQISGEVGTLETAAPESAQTVSGGEPTAKTPSPSLEGGIIGIADDKIVGWAWDPANPYESVGIELFADGLLVGQGKADRFDIELAKAKRGNGMHRFEVHLDRLPASRPPFTLRAVIAGTEVELHPSITLATLDEAERLLSGSEYLGRLTGIANGMLSGWVLNRRNPHEQPSLTLRDGDAEILTQAVIERTNAVIDAGVTANVFRFELPLPLSLLDGKQHLLSVSVGTSRRALAGSPILFGPSDVASVGRNLATSLEWLQQLDRRIDALQPSVDLPQFERQITHRILDRVDMLLNIHRDAIEREMAVLRRRVSQLAALSPGLEPDVIPPVTGIAAIEDEPAPGPTAFKAIERAAPLFLYDLTTKPATARPGGDMRWSEAVATGIAIRGNGYIQLDAVVAGPASIMMRGTGARDPRELCGITPVFQGRPLAGRFDINEAHEWTYVGTSLEGAAESAGDGVLEIRYLADLSVPSGTLFLNEVAIFQPGRIPARLDPTPPRTTIVNIGASEVSNGWHAVEAGARGGFCWMGARAEIVLRVKRTGSYSLQIPEARPLSPEIMSKLEVFLDGVPMRLEIAPLAPDASVFRIEGQCELPDDGAEALVLRLSFPSQSVKSPMELGLNDDRRPLSVAVRAVALTALDTQDR